MIYGSVCSGIEAATVAWHPLGWRPAFFSEIETPCRDVLKHRWPGVPIHGDFTTIKKGDYEPIDVLIGGTPCQDFSIAGLRKGLAGKRGNLTLEFLRLIDRLRPQWVVWENVPGVLSIDKGRAFGAFLGGLGELGYGFAYRVLDAQFYRVAQRRRRVIVIGYLGDWRPPAAVLFDGESLSGNLAPSREAGKGTSYDAAPSLTASGRGVRCAGDSRGNDPIIPMNVHTLRGEGFDASEDGSGRGTPIIPILEVDGRRDEAGAARDGLGIGDVDDPMFTLQARKQHGIMYAPPVSGSVSSKWAKGTGGPAGDECYNLVAFDSKGSQAHTEKENVSPSLRAMTGKKLNGGGQVAIAFQSRIARNGRGGPDEIASALTAQAGRSGKGDSAQLVATTSAIALDLRNALRDPEKHDEVNRQGVGIGDDTAGTITSAHQGGVATLSAIRRLTPRECERLQGLPDDYTLTPITLKKRQTRIRWQSDSARYRMIGNSFAVPKIKWLGERIEFVTKLMEGKKCSNRTSSATKKKNTRMRRDSPKNAKRQSKRRPRLRT